ncbi:MAG: hypothetical protein WCH84_03000, partial [Verrucomicrobiota bacterium]
MMGTIHGLLGLLLLPFVLLKAVLTSKVSGLEAIITCSIWVLLTLVLYAVVGFVGGILGALIYNVIAKRIGGIEFELRDLAPAGRFQPQYPVVTESLDSCNLIVGIWL